MASLTDVFDSILGVKAPTSRPNPIVAQQQKRLTPEQIRDIYKSSSSQLADYDANSIAAGSYGSQRAQQRRGALDANLRTNAAAVNSQIDFQNAERDYNAQLANANISQIQDGASKGNQRLNALLGLAGTGAAFVGSPGGALAVGGVQSFFNNREQRKQNRNRTGSAGGVGTSQSSYRNTLRGGQ